MVREWHVKATLKDFFEEATVPVAQWWAGIESGGFQVIRKETIQRKQ
jgi:hypothetical protein